MIITIDRLASRYHRLPSEVLATADTFDLYCLDVGIRYEYVQEQKRKGTWQKPAPKLSEDDLLKLMQVAKKKAK